MPNGNGLPTLVDRRHELAVWMGSRCATRQTPVPTLMVLVTAAAASAHDRDPWHRSITWADRARGKADLRDNGMWLCSGDHTGVEPALLGGDAKLLRRHRIVGEEHRDANMHCVFSQAAFAAFGTARRPCGSTLSISSLVCAITCSRLPTGRRMNFATPPATYWADAVKDRSGVADRELLVGIAAGALGVGVHRLLTVASGEPK